LVAARSFEVAAGGLLLPWSRVHTAVAALPVPGPAPTWDGALERAALPHTRGHWRLRNACAGKRAPTAHRPFRAHHPQRQANARADDPQGNPNANSRVISIAAVQRTSPEFAFCANSRHQPGGHPVWSVVQ